MVNTTIYPYGSSGQAPIIAYEIPIVTVSTTGDVLQALNQNVFYKFTSVDSLDITLVPATTGTVGTYFGKFTIDSNSSASSYLTVPSGVTLAPDCASVKSGSSYEFNIMDNVLFLVKV